MNQFDILEYTFIKLYPKIFSNELQRWYYNTHLHIQVVSDDLRIVAQIAYRILFIVIMSTNQEYKNGNPTMVIKLLLWRTTFAGEDGKSDDIYRLIVYEKTFSFSFVRSQHSQ